MKPGRKPTPTAIRRAEGNPGKRAWNHDEPVPPDGVPSCPRHLSAPAKAEWRRLVRVLHDMGVVTKVDRAALAAYCQAWGRWVEAEEKLKETPLLIRTPSGYVQQSPWLGVANRQMELMGKFMAELGITPASRSRIRIGTVPDPATAQTLVVLQRFGRKDGDASTTLEGQPITEIRRIIVSPRPHEGPGEVVIDDKDQAR